jgi:hypothetical protein
VLPASYSQVPVRLVYHSAALVLVGFATFVILRNIFGQRIVGTDDVLGAVCGYLLAAGAWSNLFMLIEIFFPGSFSVSPEFGAGLDSWHGRIAVLSYVSLGSLTSVGSGAVTPIQPPATVLTTLGSSVRAVLHRGRGCAARGREALSGVAAPQRAKLSALISFMAPRCSATTFGTHWAIGLVRLRLIKNIRVGCHTMFDLDLAFRFGGEIEG